MKLLSNARMPLSDQTCRVVIGAKSVGQRLLVLADTGKVGVAFHIKGNDTGAMGIATG